MDLKVFGWEDVDWTDLVLDRDNWRLLWTRLWTNLYNKKCGEFLDQLRKYQLFRKDSSVWS